jgi:glycosyltransferase involved in cell wall biosynthesis
VHLEGKILIVTSEYYPMPAAAAARIIPWVSELKLFCSKITVLTSNNASKEKTLIERSFFSVPNNKAKLFVRLVQELLLGLDLGLRILLKKEVSLCIITSPPFFMACCCAFFAKISGVAYVFDVRDRYPGVLEDLGVLKLKSSLGKTLQGLEAWVYRGAKHVTTVTNGLLGELRSDFPNVEFHLLRNGFDEEVFKDELLDSKKADCFTVVYHGRLGRFYDIDSYLKLIELVGKLEPNIRFLMIGHFPPKVLSLKSPNLEILPMMNLEDLSKKLSTCHLGICLLRELPAMKNAFPAKSYDFIGAGLPQLVGPEGELGETISKCGAGVSFKKINPERIARAIIDIKSNPDMLLAMRNKVILDRKNYGRRKIAQSYFQSILKTL